MFAIFSCTMGVASKSIEDILCLQTGRIRPKTFVIEKDIHEENVQYLSECRFHP